MADESERFKASPESDQTALNQAAKRRRHVPDGTTRAALRYRMNALRGLMPAESSIGVYGCNAHARPQISQRSNGYAVRVRSITYPLNFCVRNGERTAERNHAFGSAARRSGRRRDQVRRVFQTAFDFRPQSVDGVRRVRKIIGSAQGFEFRGDFPNRFR